MRIHSSVRRAAFSSSSLSQRSSLVTVRSAATATKMVATIDAKQSYDKVAEKLKELSALGGISGLLGWDEMVMMPSGSAASRGAQKSVLAGVMYDKKTDAELGTLLSELKTAISGGDSTLDAYAQAVVRDAHKEYVRATAIPKELAQKMAKLESDAYGAWVEARKASDFSKFAPFLQEWVTLSREKAHFIDPTGNPYDVLLDEYEKGMTSARLDEIFAEVRAGLVPLIASIKAKGASSIDRSIIQGDFNIDTQAALCKEVALDLGFDLAHGRLDVSVHPFTGGSHPTDVRMTTRFKPDNVMEGLTGAIHETGHALYEQGRNLEFDGLPVNSALSMGVHESQSLLWERMVALSPAFSKYLLPKLKAAFPEKFTSVNSEQLYTASNCVRDPSLIRVESDEVTYPMHIILRYEIEKGLIEGSVLVEEIPSLWSSKMESYLGSVPPSDDKGCLQDVHWSAGLFGYFPTYSLGAMYATQIYNKAAQDIPELEAKLAAGDFKPLKAYLNEKIHRVGSLYSSGDELMVAVTGNKLQPSIFLGYLQNKYTGLYKL